MDVSFNDDFNVLVVTSVDNCFNRNIKGEDVEVVVMVVPMVEVLLLLIGVTVTVVETFDIFISP